MKAYFSESNENVKTRKIETRKRKPISLEKEDEKVAKTKASRKNAYLSKTLKKGNS